MKTKKSMKRQINMRLEDKLYKFLVRYAEENYKTVTGVVRELIVDLYNDYCQPLVVRDDGRRVDIKEKSRYIVAKSFNDGYN